MSYFELKDNDVFVNTIESYPDYEFYVHSGTIYINNQPSISGSFSDNILGVPKGYISLYEYNINREQDNRIYPFVVKGGHKQTFKTISKSEWNSSFDYGGSVITSSYNMSASISRITIANQEDENYKKLRALKSSFKHYSFWSKHFDFETYYENNAVTLINIPSIFYGSSIKKGSVSLKTYISGTLASELTDHNKTGELLLDSGEVIGTVMYNEGIILLTGSNAVGTIGGLTGTPPMPSELPLSWTSAFYGIGSEEDNFYGIESGSWSLSFKGTSQVQNMTVLAKAPEGMLNHSNNPTYLKRSSESLFQMHSSSYEFVEKQREVKNIVHSEQIDEEPPFNKETYISKICLYDKDRNLIGVCKLSTPIRKREVNEYLFKMKIDL